MLIKKTSASKKQASDSCTVWEYKFSSKNLGVATAKINGRYPRKRKAVNTKCNLIYYVVSGKGILHHQSGDFKIGRGDAFFLEKKHWYWIEGEKLFIVMPSVPAWIFSQYKEV